MSWKDLQFSAFERMWDFLIDLPVLGEVSQNWAREKKISNYVSKNFSGVKEETCSVLGQVRKQMNCIGSNLGKGVGQTSKAPLSLTLEQLTTWSIEATEIRDGSRVLTTQLGI
jgi:hypothetical protein